MANQHFILPTVVSCSISGCWNLCKNRSSTRNTYSKLQISKYLKYVQIQSGYNVKTTRHKSHQRWHKVPLGLVMVQGTTHPPWPLKTQNYFAIETFGSCLSTQSTHLFAVGCFVTTDPSDVYLRRRSTLSWASESSLTFVSSSFTAVSSSLTVKNNKGCPLCSSPLPLFALMLLPATNWHVCVCI